MEYTGEEIVHGVMIAMAVIIAAAVVLALLFGIGGNYLIERIRRRRIRKRNLIERRKKDDTDREAD